ncbi:MAG: UDP-N-acetyl-D-glucosamine dehydrogenase [Acidobacteria bacterium]|nr:UDP-N-acetyl-D-glucosamine dehydrogenase [Acidobacteriota bacterium]
MEQIRVGVVGVGALGQHHARVYSSLPEATLVGVVDTFPGRAEEIAGPLGTKVFPTYSDLFGKVDAVSIATPTILHSKIGEQFLKEGVHVLVEKPIAHTLEEADRLIQAAQENKRVLQVGHLERFNPAVVQLREIVRRPRFFEAHRMGLFSPRSLDIDVILDLMIHDLDIISLLVPSPVVKVHAVGIAILTNRIDIANARIHFEDGCVANVTASRVSMEKIRKLRLFQRREYLSLDYTRQDVAVFSLNHSPGAAMPEIVSRKLTPEKKEPLREELSAFLRAAQGLQPVECTGQDGRKALALALQILAQAEKAQALEIDRA